MKKAVFTTLSLLVVIILIKFIFFAGKAFNHEEIFVPFIDSNIGKITYWNAEEYVPLLTKEEAERYTPGQWEMIMRKASKMGKLEKAGKAELLKISAISPVGKPSIYYGTYRIPLIFNTGRSVLTLSLEASENVVKINGLRWE